MKNGLKSGVVVLVQSSKVGSICMMAFKRKGIIATAIIRPQYLDMMEVLFID
jgi:hypothetical protein